MRCAIRALCSSSQPHTVIIQFSGCFSSEKKKFSTVSRKNKNPVTTKEKESEGCWTHHFNVVVFTRVRINAVIKFLSYTTMFVGEVLITRVRVNDLKSKVVNSFSSKRRQSWSAENEFCLFYRRVATVDEVDLFSFRY